MRVLNTNITDKCLKNFYKGAFFLVFLFFLSNSSSAQAPGMLEFSGRAVKDGKPLTGAVVTIWRGGTIRQQDITIGKNGKFRAYLVFGNDYKLSFSYPGCVDMHLMVYTGKLSKEKNDIFPLYETEIPFFEANSPGVRVEKYKNPFTKIIYDGKKAFMDDEAYLAQFTKDILIDPAEQAKILAEKTAKEKAEKEKMEAEKVKRDAEEKLRKEAEEKLIAEQKAKEEEMARMAELARLRDEAYRQQQFDEKESMETEAIRLQKEKEAKNVLAKKNKEIKTNYENDLLRMVAENERMAKQKALNQQRMSARSNTVINQMRKETELKARADKLRQEQKLKQKKTLENKQYKINQLRKLVEAAAFAERSIRISDQKDLPDVGGYLQKELPNVAVTINDGMVKTTRTTIVTKGKQLDTYRKETYFWGSVYCYKNNSEIDESTYNNEIAFYSGYQNK